MNLPEKLKYTKSHEWVLIEGETATMGITEFAVEQLGDVTLVECPQAGDKVVAGDSMGTIESVKAVSDLYCPISGEIADANAALEDEPEKVNDDCYGDGWIVKITLGDDASEEDLMDATAYEEYLDSLD
ncbi:MAG: glycine cleavage system protein GcvH [Deltaproteobacteria bacterium]|nr:glycine cleavage system protein GcvH [Deltaproteobacteria bacterium]MBN2674074.1 glycine cleavage system protein GcvH [Deltaproteobacteria bacterium]